MTLVLPSNTLYSLEDFDEDYEFGIDKSNNMAIHFVETSTGTITLKNGEMENPFFVSVFGGSLQNMELRDIYSNYKKVYIMCMKNNFTMNDDLFQITNQIVKTPEFYQIGSQFTLLPVSLAFLRNKVYKSRGCVVDKTHLIKMFGKNNYDTNEIIIPLIEQTEDTAKMIVSLYDPQYGVKDISNMLSITSHYNKNYKRPVMLQLSSHLASLKESQFWCDQRNCNINMTDEFMNRGFNYREQTEDGEKLIFPGSTEKSNIEVEKVISILSDGQKKDTDYLNFIHNSNEFTDVSTAIKNSDKRTYYISLDDNKLDVSKESITQMVCQIDNMTELYHTFNSLIKSKEYCHMVLNNEKVLDKVKPLFDKFGPIYKYLLGYAWNCFTIEESIMKTKTLKKNRYVFDINTANKLPCFPFVMDDLTQNPYITILVNQKVLAPMSNAVSLHCLETFNNYYGVCNLDQFKWRFNLFTTGDPSRNLFDGLDWKNYAISGSIIPACLQKKSPLFDTVALPNQREEDKWLTFFNHYYGESDIDIMCNDQSIYGFTTKVVDVINTIKSNMGNDQNDLEIEPNKSMIMLVSKYFFKERLDNFNEYLSSEYTSEEMESKLSSEEMREYLYSIYHTYKSKANNVIRKEKKDNNPYIKSFMTITPSNEMKLKEITKDILKKEDKVLDSDRCFYINDFRSAEGKPLMPEDQNFLVMKIGESVKFKIRSKSKKIKTIELFRSKTPDFFGVVARFHLPCVRAYYQGDNVHILPSCISAMMTGINIDYKYFAGVRDPIDIINKYRMRGFGILLSDQERKHMAFYNNHVKTFGGMFHVPGTDKAEISKMFGPKEITDKIYKPLVYTQGLSEDIYLKPNYSYLRTVADLKRYYKTKYNYDESVYGFSLFTIKTINDNGSIIPLKDWIANEYFNQTFDEKMDKLSQGVIVHEKEEDVSKVQAKKDILVNNESDDEIIVADEKPKNAKKSTLKSVKGPKCARGRLVT